MARFRIFPPEDSPLHDQPGFIPKSQADLLVQTGRAYSMGNRSIRMKQEVRATLSKVEMREIASMSGYDQAAASLPISDFRQAYEMRPSGGVEMWQYTANSRGMTEADGR